MITVDGLRAWTRPRAGMGRAGLAVVLAAAMAGLVACAGRPARVSTSAAQLPEATSQPAASPTTPITPATAAAGAALPAPVPCPGCWHPPLRESWQIDLATTPRAPFPPVGMIETDGFGTPAAMVAAMHSSLPGRRVVCYLDAGSWENWRPDAARFPKSLLGRPLAGYPSERWLDIAHLSGALSRIMKARVAMCKAKGFDAVDFDNVDGYHNPTGFGLTAADQLAYNVFLANTAHRLGLAVALKNDLPQIPALLPYFDFSVAEQCFQYGDCLSSENEGKYGLNQFVAAGKPVFEIEYALPAASFCPEANSDDFNALLKRLSLGPWRHPCR